MFIINKNHLIKQYNVITNHIFLLYFTEKYTQSLNM